MCTGKYFNIYSTLVKKTLTETVGDNVFGYSKIELIHKECLTVV